MKRVTGNPDFLFLLGKKKKTNHKRIAGTHGPKAYGAAVGLARTCAPRLPGDPADSPASSGLFRPPAAWGERLRPQDLPAGPPLPPQCRLVPWLGSGGVVLCVVEGAHRFSRRLLILEWSLSFPTSCGVCGQYRWHSSPKPRISSRRPLRGSLTNPRQIYTRT